MAHLNRHITQRRKIALKNLSSRKFDSPNAAEKAKEEMETLRARIDGGGHSASWYRSGKHVKPINKKVSEAA